MVKTARSVLAFVDAMELCEIDLLGFSLGGFVGEHLVRCARGAVRLLVLIGTGPRPHRARHGCQDDIEEGSRHDEGSGEDVL